MITILAGPGEVQKREKLLQIKKGYLTDNIVTLDLKKSSVNDLVLQLQSQGLFDTDKKLLIGENVSESLDLGELPQSSTDLVLVASTVRSSSKLSSSAALKKAAILQFEAEKELSAFPFIDALLEGKKSAHMELEKLMQEYGFMYVLTMIYYGLRRNFLPQKSDFIRSKVSKQKNALGVSRLKQLYKETVNTEFEIKSGLKEESLALFGLVEKYLAKD